MTAALTPIPQAPAATDFVKVTNISDRKVTIYTRFQRPKKPDSKTQRALEHSFELAPGQTADRSIAYAALVGAKNWDTLSRRKCLRLEVVPWASRFARVTAVGASVAFDIAVSGAAPKRVRVLPGEISRTVPLANVVQRRRLQNLARRVVKLERSQIGPTFAAAPAVGSLGYDDVYICYDCGGPIIFRDFPPVPIHV